jgi:hypothetical protein
VWLQHKGEEGGREGGREGEVRKGITLLKKGEGGGRKRDMP